MRAKDITAAQEQLAEILGMIPQEAWQLIVEKEPEWQHLEPLRPKFSRGSFCVFMTAAGLNAFQPKGKAETAYWAKLHELIDDFESTPSIKALSEYLLNFIVRRGFTPASWIGCRGSWTVRLQQAYGQIILERFPQKLKKSGGVSSRCFAACNRI
jgi:hypothetical protein